MAVYYGFFFFVVFFCDKKMINFYNICINMINYIYSV